MKIAVTYDNGNVFQHFGRTEAFKVFDVEEGKIISSEIFSSNGVGHEALAGLLSERRIDVLICGGMGAGAQAALSEAGIEICAGAQGDADAAVEAFLRGELVNTGVNCDHHHEGGCGGCGNCAGGCGSEIEGPNAGKTCKVHYIGTLNDGTKFDSSYDRGETLDFVCGAGMMISGFDRAVAGMEKGQVIDIHLMPEEAYGMPDPNAFITAPIAQLPGAESLHIGDKVFLYNTMGQPVPVTVSAKNDTDITFDANHEMAGKELNFRIELVDVL